MYWTQPGPTRTQWSSLATTLPLFHSSLSPRVHIIICLLLDSFLLTLSSNYSPTPFILPLKWLSRPVLPIHHYHRCFLASFSLPELLRNLKPLHWLPRLPFLNKCVISSLFCLRPCVFSLPRMKPTLFNVTQGVRLSSTFLVILSATYI